MLLNECDFDVGLEMVSDEGYRCHPCPSCKGLSIYLRFELTHVVQKEEEIEGVKTVSALESLPSPSDTSVSVITPPKVCPFVPASVSMSNFLFQSGNISR